MHLEIQQVHYIEEPSTDEQRADYAEMNPGYGILAQYTTSPNVRMVAANRAESDVVTADEVIVSARHHRMTMSAEGANASLPFTTFPDGPRWDEDSQTWKVLALYLHGFPREAIVQVAEACAEI